METREISHDNSSKVCARRLVVEIRDAVVADVWIRKGHDLACIAWVGHHFLIATEGRIKDDFATRISSLKKGSRCFSFEASSVREDQMGDASPHRCASPSITTASPRAIV